MHIYLSQQPTNQLQTGVALTLNTENITSIPNIPDYNYPSTDIHLLQTQLEKWNLSCVFQTCIGNNFNNSQLLSI